MRHLLIVGLFSLFIQNITAQQSVYINWSTQKEASIVVNGEATIYAINADNFIDDANVYRATFAIKGLHSYKGALTIKDVKYEDITKEEFGANTKVVFSNALKPLFLLGTARDEFIHSVTLSPIICTDDRCKKLVSFKVEKSFSTQRSNKQIAKKSFDLTKRNSVLASGNWKKVRVDTTGIFQITPDILNRLGFNSQSTEPNNIKIFGFGGKSLPLLNSENRFFDPPEVAVDVIGGGDGSFSGNDRIYFYGVGSKGWNTDNASFVNPYSSNTYYYITVDGTASKKIANLVEPTAVATTTFNSYDYQTYFERDKNNLFKQGREWFDDNIDLELSRSYNFFVPERVNDERIEYKFRVAGEYIQPPSVTISSNMSGDTAETVTLNTPTRSLEYQTTLIPTNVLGADVSSTNIALNLTFDKNGDPSSVMNLDYITLNAKCKLAGFNRQFEFYNIEEQLGNSVGQYVITNASTISAVWDITDPYNPTKKSFEGNNEAVFKVQLGRRKVYRALDSSNIFSPSIPSDVNVANQDIKGNIFLNNRGQEESVDYLIITHSSLVPAAQRLASFRNRKGLNSRILTVESIYNEFSNGQQDISAIRNAIRYIYENAPSVAERLRFVCFLGTPSYDYKDRIEGNVNLVPTFHARSGNSRTASYPSDDFCVMLDELEGGNVNVDKMDVAVGRIISSDLTVANQMIDKIIDYDNSRALGSWRRNFTFIADDPQLGRDTDGQLQVMTNFAADRLNTNVERARVNKIFADAFEQVATSAGPQYPEVANQIESSFENGSLMSFYLGHGGLTGLADESIFTSNTAINLTNETRPNIFVTVTCELTRLDNPVDTSAGELLFLNRRGGSVALITTVRDIFVNVALSFYPTFVDNLFDENKSILPIGEALRLTKLDLSSANKRSIFCLGDPALIPGIPPLGIKVDAVNDDQLFNSRIVTNGINKEKQILQGLSRTTINGSVIKPGTNEIDNTFNGVATISVFDTKRQQKTLANDRVTNRWIINETSLRLTNEETTEPHEFEFTVPGRLLFSGKASISNGKYSTEFIMPRNISETEVQGTISIYAENAQQGLERLDVKNISVGGIDENAPEDNVPPQIEIFLNDVNFQEGQLVSPEPLIIARFTDESGINTSGGIGHDIIAIVDGDEANPILLNEFYESEIDDFSRGRIEYRLLGLNDGEHTLEIRVSDTYNNVSSKEITFNSANANDFDIQRVLNYPNPFTSKTGFWFSHTGSPTLELEVYIQIFTVTGKIVKSLRTIELLSNESTYRNAITWDGKDDFGNKLGKGTYLYKISVKSPLMNKTVTKIEKLVIL